MTAGEVDRSSVRTFDVWDLLVNNIISSCWGVFIAVWLLAAIFTKRTVYRESGAQR